MSTAFDLRRKKDRVATFGAFDLRRSDSTVSPPDPVLPATMTLKSDGDVLNPKVGDLLYVEYINFDGNARELEDLTSSGTQIKYFADDALIVIPAGFRQYMIKSVDAGKIISSTVEVYNQQGVLVETLTDSLTTVVTDDLNVNVSDYQDKFDLIYDLTRGGFPSVVPYIDSEDTTGQIINPTNGTEKSLATWEEDKALVFNPLENGFYESFTTGQTSAYFARRPWGHIKGNDFTMAWKVRPKDANSNKIWLRQLEEFSHVGSTERFFIGGAAMANNTAPLNKWVTYFIRTSSTAFTSTNGTAATKSEIYVSYDDGATETLLDKTANVLVNLDIDLRPGVIPGVSTTWSFNDMDVKLMAFKMGFMNDTDFTNFKTILNNI